VQKFSKSAIRTEIIEFGIDFYHIKPPGVFHTCLSQELEGFFGFTEASTVYGLLVRVIFDQFEVLFQIAAFP
jgi:hypothetical protein